MNIRISTFVRMDPGDEPLLGDLVTDIADLLLKHGYANHPDDEDSAVQSLIAIHQFPIDESQVELFLREQFEGAFKVVLPVADNGEGEKGASNKES